MSAIPPSAENSKKTVSLKISRLPNIRLGGKPYLKHKMLKVFEEDTVVNNSPPHIGRQKHDE